ncbi:MAG: hypothetical protein JRC86_00770 [Deltaproteobacteria bacterium]|nr:hypothetical protein [Deltaproteobacteria bacterium]
MAISRVNAKDAMLTLVKGVADANGLTHVVYENVDVDGGNKDQMPKTQQTWMRVLIRHRTGAATSLPGVDGSKKFQADGIVFIELMVPTGTGTNEADALAAKFETAFKTRQTLNQDVWYTDVVSQEAGTSDGYFKTNVVAAFHYDTDE